MKKRGANAYIAEEVLDHVVDLQRLAAAERKKVLGLLKKMLEEVTAKLANSERLTPRAIARFKKLDQQIRKTIATAYDDISAGMRETLQQTAVLEATFITKTINQALKVPVTSVGLSKNLLRRIADRTLVLGVENSAWWDRQKLTTQNRFMDEIRTSMSLGESIDETVRRIRGRATGRREVLTIAGKKTVFPEFKGGLFDMITRQAEGLARSTVQTIANQARIDTLKENSDVIKGIQWMATLDSRTTMICMTLDGKVWDLDYKPIGHSFPFPGPTAHWNCRSTQVPVLRTMAELGMPELAGLEDLEGTRPVQGGEPVPVSVTFEKWFSTRSEERQREILGPAKWKLWKDNNLTFSQMVDQRGNPLTIDELTRKVGN